MRFGAILLGVLLVIPALGADEERLPCTIMGRVWAAEEQTEEQWLSRLENAPTTQEAEEALKSSLKKSRRPAAGALVTAKGDRLTRTTTSDSSGRYVLAVGVETYEVSATMPGTTAASSSEQVYADRGRPRDLQLRTDIVSIRGKVTNAAGEPIAGARVVGEESKDSETYETIPDRDSTKTAADGTFDLKGFNPPHLWQIAGYLNGGTGGESFNVVLTATASGMNKQTVVIPLITEVRLPLARRLHQTLLKRAKESGQTGDLKEPANRPLPASTGNAITDVNIVLEPSETR